MQPDMNALQVFRSAEFGELRTTLIGGAVWTVGKDVAQALGYKEPAKAVRDHVDPEDRGVSKMDTPSGEQTMTIINESGLYSLILSSKLPGARAFKRWVTAEVLPAIRQTGGYAAQGAGNGAEETIRLMRELMDARAENAALRLKMAQEELIELRARVREAEAGAEARQTELERKREGNRIRQQRHREKLRQAAQGDK